MYKNFNNKEMFKNKIELQNYLCRITFISLFSYFFLVYENIKCVMETIHVFILSNNINKINNLNIISQNELNLI